MHQFDVNRFLYPNKKVQKIQTNGSWTKFASIKEKAKNNEIPGATLLRCDISWWLVWTFVNGYVPSLVTLYATEKGIKWPKNKKAKTTTSSKVEHC